MASDCRMMDTESRVATVQTVAGHMQDSLEIQRDVGAGVCSKPCTGYVTCLYLCIKVLYAINCAGQIFLLNSFLGTRSLVYGFEILNKLMVGAEWQETGHFPRVTMCDFEVRVLGNVHHHTVQCVLMINMFNEKIFLFLWFWYFLVAIVTVLSLLHWMFICLLSSQRERFVRRYLKATELVTDNSSVEKFVLKFLGSDGVFCLRMISAHAGDLINTELIVALWHDFHNQSRKSPIEMYEGGANMPSPSKMQELSFRNWLMSQGSRNQQQSGSYDSNAAKARKRRKSDSYFTFV